MDNSYQNITTLHPMAMVLFALCAAWMLGAPRHLAVIGPLVLSCFVSQAQRLVLGGFDFTLTKLMVLAGFLRLLMRGEFRLPPLHFMDYFMFAWVVVNTTAYTMLFGTSAAFVNRLGWAYDVLGLYFVFRMLLRDWRDLDVLTQTVLWLSLPVAVFFAVEKVTAHNAFSAFGGVEATTLIRDGRLRCQGAFAHPIIAGTFWALLLPLPIAELLRPAGLSRRHRMLVIGGLVAMTFIIIATASSTPVVAVMVVIAGFMLFPLRQWLPVFIAAGVVTLVVLHFYRDKPVWHLLARIDLAGGSTGWHRYHLVDGAIHGFAQWWALGAPNTEFLGEGVQDITNQYLVEGFRGGIAALLLFLASIGAAFGCLRHALRRFIAEPRRQMQVWGLVVVLAGHCASFLSVSYFGQATTLWYLQLAAIANVGSMACIRAIAARRAPITRRLYGSGGTWRRDASLG